MKLTEKDIGKKVKIDIYEQWHTLVSVHENSVWLKDEEGLLWTDYNNEGFEIQKYPKKPSQIIKEKLDDEDGACALSHAILSYLDEVEEKKYQNEND